MYHVYIYIYHNISLGFLFSSDHYFRHFQLSPCFMFSYLVYVSIVALFKSVFISKTKQTMQSQIRVLQLRPMKPLFQNDTSIIFQ